MNNVILQMRAGQAAIRLQVKIHGLKMAFLTTQLFAIGTFALKTGLAQMLKGGIIMDVTDAAQAKIAEEAGVYISFYTVLSVLLELVCFRRVLSWHWRGYQQISEEMVEWLGCLIPRLLCVIIYNTYGCCGNMQKIKEIMEAVTIPVMAKVRIGHFVEAQILESLGVDFIDESEG